MTANAKCPFCEKPITVWAIMKAPVPSAVRCLHCREKIRVQNVRAYLLAYLLIALLLMAILVIATLRNVMSPAALVLAAVGVLLFCEFTISALVLRHGTLTKP